MKGSTHTRKTYLSTVNKYFVLCYFSPLVTRQRLTTSQILYVGKSFKISKGSPPQTPQAVLSRSELLQEPSGCVREVSSDLAGRGLEVSPWTGSAFHHQGYCYDICNRVESSLWGSQCRCWSNISLAVTSRIRDWLWGTDREAHRPQGFIKSRNVVASFCQKARRLPDWCY